jgi:hypothetical protein
MWWELGIYPCSRSFLMKYINYFMHHTRMQQFWFGSHALMSHVEYKVSTHVSIFELAPNIQGTKWRSYHDFAGGTILGIKWLHLVPNPWLCSHGANPALAKREHIQAELASCIDHHTKREVIATCIAQEQRWCRIATTCLSINYFSGFEERVFVYRNHVIVPHP